MIARHQAPGPAAAPPADAADRLRVAGRAAGRLRDDATRLLAVRRDDLAAALRRAVWRAAATALLLLAGVTAVVTATVLTLRGMADWLGGVLGGSAFGALAVGAAVLLLFLMAAAWGVRDPQRERRAAERAAATQGLQRDGRHLVRAIGVVPGAAIAAASGFAATRLLRHRSVRRAALVAFGALRRGGLGGRGGAA